MHNTRIAEHCIHGAAELLLASGDTSPEKQYIETAMPISESTMLPALRKAGSSPSSCLIANNGRSIPKLSAMYTSRPTILIVLPGMTEELPTSVIT